MQLQKHKTDGRTGISYTLIGDYYLPDVALSKTEYDKVIGILGQHHLQYIKQNKRVYFNIMLTNGTLYSYLADIDRQAKKMFSTLVKQMAVCEGITEKLKEENQIEWVRRMNYIQNRATEIVNMDLIYI